MTCNSISQLRTVVGNATDNFYNVLGYNIPGDSGGGDFFWDAASTVPDNSGTIIKPDLHTGAGRWTRLFPGNVSVKWFGATGDGATDDSAAIEAALAFSSNIFFPAGTYKSNFITPEGQSFSINLRGATLTPNDTSKPVITCRNLSWTLSEIIGGKIDGINHICTGIELGAYDNGRVKIIETEIRNCFKGVSKSAGTIGCVFENMNLVFNRIGFMAISSSPPELEHSGCDIWTGGNVSENNYGILYFNIVPGWGQVILNGVILQYNEINGIFYSTHSGIFGGFTFNSLWNEGAYVRDEEIDLVIPAMADKPYFDATGKWTGPKTSVVVYGDCSIDGMAIDDKPILLDSSTDVDNVFVGYKKYLFPTQTNTTAVLRTANFVAGAIDLPIYRINRITKADLSDGRGFFALFPQDSRKMWQIPELTGIQSLPSGFIGAVPSSLNFDAVYENSGAIFTSAFSADSYKLIDDVPDSEGILYHSVTITMLEPASPGDKMYFFLREDGAHNYGTTPRGEIALDKLTPYAPVTLVICVAAKAGKSAGIWWQGAITPNTVHVQDMFQFTTGDPDFPVEVYNKRGCISL